MHVIIFYQIVIFSRLINFYKFFNDIYFTHVILLLESKYPNGRMGTKISFYNFFNDM